MWGSQLPLLQINTQLNARVLCLSCAGCREPGAVLHSLCGKTLSVRTAWRPVKGRDHYGPEENHDWPKRLPWRLLLSVLIEAIRLPAAPPLASAWDLSPCGPNNRERLPEQLERGWACPLRPRLKNCSEGDNRNRLKGWDWWPLMGLRIKPHSTKGPLIHPPFSFRCSSAPGLAPERKHNTHLPGRVFA